MIQQKSNLQETDDMIINWKEKEEQFKKDLCINRSL